MRRFGAAAIAVGLTFYGACSSFAPFGLPVEQTVESFDEIADADAARRIRALDIPRAPDSRSRVEFRLDPDNRPGKKGRSLHVSYVFDTQLPEEVGLGVELSGLDASPYDHVALWVRGDARPGFDPTLKFGFKRPDPQRNGLLETGSYVIHGVRGEWQRIVVPLNLLSGIRNWTGLSQFFVSFESRRVSAPAGGYFIDDITLLRTGERGPTISDLAVPARKLEWIESAGGPEAAQALARQRLRDWPRRLLADRDELPRADRELAWRIARDTWRGLDALTDRENGLPMDHVRFGAESVAPAASRIGDYTSSTNVGLHLAAVAAAHELDLLSRPEALERIGTMLDTLERLETHAGFFFNFYDTVTLERTSNFLSFVDSSWLTAGLMVVRMTFPEVRDRCTRLIDAGDYGFFYDDVTQLMSHGYYANVPTRSPYHYGLLYTEARLGSLIAIGKGDAPEEHWYRIMRTLPPAFDWQTQSPKGMRIKSVRGHRFAGGYYEWNGLRYVPSWGGSMFEALMPVVMVDERRWAPRSLGRNGEVHVEVQRRWALDKLGYAVWGMSPSATPSGDDYGEYGVEVLGAAGYRSEAVTPHAAALALAIEPEAAIADLRKLLELYDVYGDYGFYDAVDPLSGRVAHKYLVLDQSMIFLALANHLGDRCVSKRFASDPIAERVLPMLADESFFD